MPIRTDAIAISRGGASPAPIFHARDGCGEPRMQSIPKSKTIGSKKRAYPDQAG
jgi:hypothetical protein